ncbi:MAG: sulfatase-like hydrolase/transferase, partial [Myxococcota bacterium]
MKIPQPIQRASRECADAVWLHAPRLLFGATLFSALLVACVSEKRPPNILLITLDTTRPDHLGPYGHEKAHTPNLDRFSEHARVYENAYATSSWTLASHASILTGLLPRQHGAQSVPKGPNRSLGYGVRPLSDSFLTLAEILSRAGYRTGAVIAGPALRSELGTAQGFEIYSDELNGPLRLFNGKRAEETTDLALEVLEQFGDAPFFLFVNYFDPHAPYAPPVDLGPPTGPTQANAEADVESGEKKDLDSQDKPTEPFSLPRIYFEKLSANAPPRAREASPPEELAEIHKQLSAYDSEIAYLDHHLGRLLDAIDRLPPGEETWVIITADHGESFGEHYFVSHGAHLYEDNVRVPLIVRPARSESGQRISQAVQNHRLFGSVLEMAGQPLPEWALPLPNEDEVSEIILEVHRSDSNILIGGDFFDRDLFSLLAPPFKLIRSSKGDVELFDLSSDPEELDNLVSKNPELAAQMAERLSVLLDERPPLYPEPESLE